MDAQTPTTTPITTPADLRPTLDRLRAAWRARKPDHAQRMADLARLKTVFRRRMRRSARTSATAPSTRPCWPTA